MMTTFYDRGGDSFVLNDSTDNGVQISTNGENFYDFSPYDARKIANEILFLVGDGDREDPGDNGVVAFQVSSGLIIDVISVYRRDDNVLLYRCTGERTVTLDDAIGKGWKPLYKA